MKKLLYIGRPNLGENMFATPVLDFLSKEYEITLLVPKHTIKAFCDYPFIKRVLAGCNHGDPRSTLPKSTLNDIRHIFKPSEETFYTYHHDDDVNFMQNHPELAHINRLNVLHDKEINIYSNTHNSDYFLSRTKKYMIKLGLMTLEQTMNYDCSVRTPPHNKYQKSNDIIIYQGSKEPLRKLPIQTIYKFTEQCPKALYMVTQETADILNFKQKNIRHIITDPFSEESMNNIITAFRSEPKAFIGPDSGLTQLACAYRIPLIWLQSRILFENVIDIYHKSHSTVYTKRELNCKKDCLACLRIEHLKYGMYKVTEKRMPHKQMECFINKTPTCLEYSESEVKEILDLVYTKNL